MVQVWRLTTEDGQSFLGRLVPAPIVGKLAGAFGIDARVEVSGAETVKHVLQTGETMSVGTFRLKRSLVAGNQRLELLDWEPNRLSELKAFGCFTEIIQYKTRLFLPPGTAAEILKSITG